MPSSSKPRRARQVTGRAGYIVAQALSYAIVVIERLPTERQEWSNLQDMYGILSAMVGKGTAVDLLDGASWHVYEAPWTPDLRIVPIANLGQPAA